MEDISKDPARSNEYITTISVENIEMKENDEKKAADIPESPKNDPDESKNQENKQVLGIFEKGLTLWVLACMGIGVVLGYFVPQIPDFLKGLLTNYVTQTGKAEIAQVSMPIAVLLWGMIFPMMVQIDLTSLKKVWLNPKGILLTSGINYLIQPFTMYGLALLFFEVIFRSALTDDQVKQYIAGAVILGGSPCTAMVFAWSALTNGNPAYTLSQVAVNDILILIVYSPTVKLLLDVYVSIPWDTLLLSVGIFVLVPLLAGSIVRLLILRLKGLDYLNEKILPKLKPFMIIFLLLTLILIFLFQATPIVQRPLNILMIALPLTIQTFAIWVLAYSLGYLIKLPFDVAAPGSMIAASNFFELAVAVTISLYTPDDGSVLVTTVGVLTEVPVMLTLVFICNHTKHLFDKRTSLIRR